jgi:hypothetical protein
MSDDDLEPLDEQLAGMFAAERSRSVAAPGSKARVFSRLLGNIAGGGGGSGSGSAPATATGMKLAPLLAAFVIGGAAGAGILQAVRPPTVVYVERTAPVATASAASTAPEEVALGLAPTTVAPEAAPSASPSSAAPLESSASARDAALAREREILDIARTALGRGDGAHALEAIDRHAREFPRGQMTEEREAIAVQALAKLGRGDEAEARATRFRKRYPNSVLLPVIDAATNLK